MSVIARISDFHDDMQPWRRDIHEHPELGLAECYADEAPVAVFLLR
jgi:metal-dependent amidase/aminoacylase/carboxypeptidase family protein